MLQLGRSPVYVAQITSLTLAIFHWLCAPERIDFELAVLVYRSLHGTAPHLDTCLSFFAVLLTCRLVVVYSRQLTANSMCARRVS